MRSVFSAAVGVFTDPDPDSPDSDECLSEAKDTIVLGNAKLQGAAVNL